MRSARLIDGADLDPGPSRHGAHDVRVRDVAVRGRDPAAVEAVRRVVAAYDGSTTEGVVVGLDGGDLASDERFGVGLAEPRTRDDDARAHPDAGGLEHLQVHVAQRQLEHVGQVQMVIDDDHLQQRFQGFAEGRAIDLDGRLESELAVSHAQPSRDASLSVGTSTAVPMATRIGSSRPLNVAIARHSLASPYSAQAIDWSV